MAYKTVKVDIDLDDFDLDEIVEHLIEKKGWREEINRQLAAKNEANLTYPDGYTTKDLINAYKIGKDITPILRDIAYNQCGMVV